MHSASDVVKQTVLDRNGRFFVRIMHRNAWHWKGVLLWLIQKPHLRRLPLPPPGVETRLQYAEQASRPGRPLALVDDAVMQDLVSLRIKMGNRLSYLENESISTALRESEAKRRNRKKGVMQLLRMQEVVADPNVPRLGPRGGLPKTKVELQALARSWGVDHVGTVDVLRARLKVAAANHGQIVTGILDSTAAASSSLEATADDDLRGTLEISQSGLQPDHADTSDTDSEYRIL